MAATLHDVAALAGVSFKTVSNVINDYPHVRESTRQRVLDAIERLDYRPNVTARSLRLGRTGVIGLAVPELALPYFAELAAEVISAAEKRGLVVLTEQTNLSRGREMDALTGPRRLITDGLILSARELTDADVELLLSNGPLVLLGEALFPDTVDHVTMRNVAAARAATEYLIGLGHRNIAVIGADPDRSQGSAALRMQGYRAGLAAHGIPFDPRLVGVAPRWQRLAGSLAMQQVLRSGAELEAVFAFNDTLAFGAMHALDEAGLRVPGDVSVIGFDDIDEASYSVPTLTSVDAGRRQIAEIAVDRLVRRIADPASSSERIEVDFSIVERESARRR